MSLTEQEANHKMHEITLELEKSLAELSELLRQHPTLNITSVLVLMLGFRDEWQVLQMPQVDYDSGWDFMGDLK